MADSEQSSDAASAPAPRNLGQVLRDARLKQDLTIEQLAMELRIEAKQLTALEENRFEQIGVPVFVKGYLKQYGTRLGLDVRDLLGLYYDQVNLGEVRVQPRRTIKLRDERQITSWLLALIVLVALGAGLAVWWWNGSFDAARPASESAPVRSPSAAPAEPVAAVPERAVPEPAAAVVPPVSAPVAAPAAVTDPAPAASEPAALPADVARGDALLEDGGESADDASADGARAVPPVMIPLQFSFDADSWAEVTDGRGERLLFGLNAAGRSVTVRGEPPFTVVLGNAPAVRLVVDGAPFAVPVGRQGDTARFSVDIAEE
jgi:cytoskeleton protein RodZ